MTYYRLNHQEWLLAASSLCPAEKDILLHLRSKFPFIDGKQQLLVQQIAADLDYHFDTVLRILRQLRQKGWLKYKVRSYLITLLSFDDFICKDLCGSFDRLKDDCNEMCGSFDRLNENENLDSVGVSDDLEVTNNRSLKFKDQTVGETPGNGQSGFGQILAAIETAGIRANTTIQRTIQKLYREFGPAAAARRVELAIEAMREQQNKGFIKNPGGWLNVALQRCFTPNDDGYREQTRGRSPEPVAATSTDSPPPSPPLPALPSSPPRQTALPSVVPPPPPPSPPMPPEPPLPDANQLEQTCDKLLLQGDRQRVLERLQELIAEGYLSEVRSLLSLRRDWKFKIRAGDRLVDVS